MTVIQRNSSGNQVRMAMEEIVFKLDLKKKKKEKLQEVTF